MSECFYCADCEVNIKNIHEFHFKIKSEIWLSVANSSECLCIGCLEIRLKRRLIPEDFPRESINRVNFGKKSARLLNRLNKEILVLRRI